MRVKLYLQMMHLKDFRKKWHWIKEQTFHKEMRGTGSAASIVGHEARIISTLHWLHLKQLQLSDKVFQRNGACLP